MASVLIFIPHAYTIIIASAYNHWSRFRRQNFKVQQLNSQWSYVFVALAHLYVAGRSYSALVFFYSFLGQGYVIAGQGKNIIKTRIRMLLSRRDLYATQHTETVS